MLAKMPVSLLNGLPHFTGARKPVGATRSTPGAVARVAGSPSMRVIRDKGGVKTILRRNMTNADLLNDADFERLQKLLEQVEGTARRLSQGGLSHADLRRMGHPYGKGNAYGKGARRGLGRLRGAGRGVSNRAIVNRHSGNFERSWDTQFLRDKSGVSLMLENEAEYAAYLAFGTRRMKAHGPFTTAMAKHLSAIDAEWRRLARVATARNKALADESFEQVRQAATRRVRPRG